MPCPQCQMPAEPGARFCGHCGAQVPAAQAAPAPHSRRKLAMALAGLAAAAVLVAAGIAFAGRRARAAWETTAHALVDALRQEHVARAYGLTSRSFQESVPDAPFALMARSVAATLKGSTLVVQGGERHGGGGLLRAQLAGKDGRTKDVEFLLANEDGAWRVDRVRLLRAEPRDGATERAGATWVRKSHDCRGEAALAEQGVEFDPDDEDDPRLFPYGRILGARAVALPGAWFLVLTRATKGGSKVAVLRTAAAEDWEQPLRAAAARARRAQAPNADDGSE